MKTKRKEQAELGEDGKVRGNTTASLPVVGAKAIDMAKIVEDGIQSSKDAYGAISEALDGYTRPAKVLGADITIEDADKEPDYESID